MKKLVVIVLVLCIAAIGCNPEDTAAPKKGRPAEMRFSGEEWTTCCSDPADAKLSCDDNIGSRQQAVQLLLARRSCTDKAIYALGNFAATDPAAKNDLAAAYYVRYKRSGRPVDLLHSLEALEDAPQTAETAFNRGVAQEALGLAEDAILSWDAAQKYRESHWHDEAAGHLIRLRHLAATDAAALWSTRRGQLNAALARRDRAGVAAVVNEFPFSSQKYFEDDLLTNWANEPAAQQIGAARLMAEELSKRLGNDAFDVEIVHAIEGATDAQREVLRKAQLAFHAARVHSQTFDRPKASAAYEAAAELFARAGSPMRLLASLEFATASRPDEKALTLAARTEAEAAKRRYVHLAARCNGMLSYIFQYKSRYFESLSTLDRALQEYSRLRDDEGKAITAVSTSGELRMLGQLERSWQFALDAVRSQSRLVDSRRRHAAFGEAAQTALALGFPRIALAYQNAAIHTLERGLVATLDRTQIAGYRQQLGMAFRHRSEIEAVLERMPDAQRDVNEAIRLRGNDDPAALGIQAHIEEITGRIALRVNPKEAAAAFTRAIDLMKASEYRTFRASLYAQRAAALRRQGLTRDAENDLQTALAELHTEQQEILRNRTDAGEEFWSTYFSRSQETYRQLIRQLADEGDLQRAFAYTESARGYEPLDLVLSRNTAPQKFRDLTKDGPASLTAIRAELEPGTFIFEYCVLDDEATIVWIISRDGFDHALLPIGAARLKSFSERAQKGDENEFDVVLSAQYDALIARPLAIATRMNAGRLPSRLVISPDSWMHGLALAASRSNAPNRPYLGEQLPIEIAGSSTLYLLSLLRDRDLRNARNAPVLLVGDPAFDIRLPQAQGLEPLPGADNEISELAGLYGNGVTELRGTDATIERFAALARQSSIIHVAAHAVVDPNAPARSVILLAPSETNSGALDAQELLRTMKLDRTRLVVLAACSSAGGLPVGPEGVAPLVRPLIAAGASAVLGTLWSVRDDATTTRLLVSFHKHYLEGNDAAAALQLAQRDVRESGQWPAKSWAAFQVIGHSSSPFARSAHIKEKPP